MLLRSAFLIFTENFHHTVARYLDKGLSMSYRDLITNLKSKCTEKVTLKESIIIELLQERGCYIDYTRNNDEDINYYPLQSVTPGIIFLKYKNKLFQLVLHEEGTNVPWTSRVVNDCAGETIYSVVLNFIEDLGNLHSAIPIAIATNEFQFREILTFLEKIGNAWLSNVKTRYHFVQVYPKFSNYQLHILSNTSRHTPYPSIYV